MQVTDIGLRLPGILVEQTKFFTIFSKQNKKAYFSGKRLQLQEFQKEYGENFSQITCEEAKIKHLGKIRSIGIISDCEQLINVLLKYFKTSSVCKPTNDYSLHEINRNVVKAEKRNQKNDHTTIKNDEINLVLKYRASTSEREKNKIFNVILYERGTTDGKTWDKTIRDFVSINKFRFKNISDHDESDFYQVITMALHKQVEKWFDTQSDVKFSTYAWYVIRSAFGRKLQALGTQKRKVTYQMNNVDLDNQEICWDEIISSEKTVCKNSSFEEELVNKDFCAHIHNIFELKDVDISPELREDLLNVIKNKSVIKSSLYDLAKKHNVDIEKLFEIELTIRNNMKNSMYNDILLFIKHGINADNEIAKKYNRSKGHVIKMKRQLSQIVRSKMKIA